MIVILAVQFSITSKSVYLSMKRLITLLIGSTLGLIAANAQDFQFIKTETETGSSFRGLSVVDDSVAWVSGSKGWVGRSINGGKDWRFMQVSGYEEYDFRALFSFNNQKAIIANAGSPAHILLTEDGGLSWKLVYKNEHADAFLDGLTFWNDQEGVIYGDPINLKMIILSTQDGGSTWKELAEEQKPSLEIGEASFAASGTTIRSQSQGKVIIATGGTVSRLWFSDDKGQKWLAKSCPIIQGQSSTGIFSLAFWDQDSGIIVGGDYTQDTLKTNHIFLTNNNGETWQAPQTPTEGFRSCVEYLNQNTLLATGTSGVDVSIDGGLNWKNLSTESYHVVRKARNGTLVVLTGGGGKVTVLKN
jgi:photosystem II stability/assembly factor-like uncharacterized protein